MYQLQRINIRSLSFRLTMMMLLIAAGYPLLSQQEALSSRVPFFLNNLPDHEAPVINILSPDLDSLLRFETEVDEAQITGRVEDGSAIDFAAVGGEKVEINERGLFSTRIRLYPGENRIRIVASDTYHNLQEKRIVLVFKPAGLPVEITDPSQ